MADSDSKSGVTSYIASVQGVLQTLDSYGLDGKAIFAEIGVNFDETPSFDSRVSYPLIHRALIRHTKASLDPLFGLKYAEFVNPTTYHAFGVMLTSSTTLRKFCQRIQRYYPYVNTGDKVYFYETGELVYQQADIPELEHDDLEILINESAWAATFLKLVRMLYRPDYAPVKVDMAFAEPEGYTGEFSEYFSSPIQYGTKRTTLYFDPRDLDIPLPGGNAELARHSETLVFNYLRTLTDTDIVNAARMSLFELLPRGDFTLESLAASLDLSARALTDQLKSSGTSYQQLLGDTRRELAEEYILRADLSVNEITYMLGFSDCSNFARSFRRWTGKSPTDFRESLQQEN